MVVISLQNASRTINLDWVTDYIISKKTSYPVQKIPDKQGPTIDPDGKTTSPRTYTIDAVVAKAERDEILNMESDRLVITLDDGDINDDGCYMDGSPECRYLMGRDKDGLDEGRPWTCHIMLLSSNN